MVYTNHSISDICTLIKGEYSSTKTEPGDYPLVVTAEYRRSSDSYQLEGPAVCVPLISSTGHGDAAMHRVHYQEGRFALANLLVALIPKDHSICYAKYLYYLLQTKKDEYFVPLMSGTANVSLKMQDIASINVPLPPLEEQRRIVARIEELARKIEEAKGLRREATEEVATFVSSIHIELAKERLISLDDVLLLDEQQEAVIPGKQYPQVGIRGFGGGLFARSSVDATQTTYKAFNRLYNGAIILSQVKGWEGAIAGCSEQFAGMYASPEYRTFRCKPECVHPEYMAALVVTPWFWQQLKSLSRGVGARRERTRPEQFLSLKIVMPTLEQQVKALKIFPYLNELQKSYATTQEELNMLLPSILDKAFKGEL